MDNPVLGASDVVWRVLIVLLLVLANGFFVAAEFAVVTVRRTRIDQLVSEGSRLALAVRRIMKEPERYIAASQLAITMTSLGLGWIGESQVASLIAPLFEALPAGWRFSAIHTAAVATAFALITTLQLVLGELIPKTIALQHAERTALIVARPTELFMHLVWPFTAVLGGLGHGVGRLLGLKPPSGASMVHSEDELKMLVTASQEAGVLEEDEEEMLHRVFGFSDLTAGQIMLPRTEMTALPVQAPVDEITRLLATTAQPILPVYRQGLDDIVGVVHVRDLFRLLRPAEGVLDLASVAAEALTIPETLKADDVLNEMRRMRTSVALVIDEYGGTAGIVTFERLMERIVGEIGDGVDGEASQITVLTDGSALLDGLALTTDVNERFGMKIDEQVYNTIGGFVLGLLGRRPKLGDAVEFEGRRIRVEALDGLRVARVLLSSAKDSVKPEQA